MCRTLDQFRVEVEPDFIVIGGAAVYIVEPQNDDATQHLLDHTADEALWWHRGLVVEHRYIVDLVTRLEIAGYVVQGLTR